ncbi:MAG: asparagine synthase (glutamine-hydrolyzing) [Candidatus Aureabacteria bacterium]|nr:asparagine synthase (glutamine-hydrolyzing) [Candidatus Auribacterota bacterium]
MCGICGYYSRQLEPEQAQEILKRMINCLKHRGPDSQGTFVLSPVALGHTRLKIIDLEGGAQPIVSEDGLLSMVYNGEIYNYPELRQKLIQAGYSFKTHSDTEVLFKMYQAYGRDCLSFLNGMFAFMIYDKKNDCLFGARDRLGLKPLYYHERKGCLIFGSELKAVLSFPGVNRSLNQDALQEYLCFDYVPAPRTIFNDIYKLPPGHALTYQNGSLKVYSYWDLTFSIVPGITEEEWQEQLRDSLFQSVKKRLAGDVPFGLFLSGGTDSSILFKILTKTVSQPINIFTISFTETGFDESPYVQDVIHGHKADKYIDILTENKARELMIPISHVIDEPLADPSLIPTYFLSRLARQNATFVLGGDGGDELFAGYPSFSFQKWASFFQGLDPWIGGLLRHLIKILPASSAYRGSQFVIEKYISAANWPPPLKHFIWFGSFGIDEMNRLMGTAQGTRPSFCREIMDFWETNRDLNWFNRLQKLYMKYYLPEDILVKVDRASMANSLEVRNPYLDFEYVQLVNSMPNHLKLKGLTAKYLLKKAFEHELPHSILHRPKQGFAIPIGVWLKGAFRDLCEEYLDERTLRSQGLFQAGVVKQYLSEHFSGKRDHRKRLWSLLMFQLWSSNWR